MTRLEILEWMDAVAPLWGNADYQTQQAVDRWWWELFEALKWESLELCPAMWWKRFQTGKKRKP